MSTLERSKWLLFGIVLTLFRYVAPQMCYWRGFDGTVCPTSITNCQDCQGFCDLNFHCGGYWGSEVGCGSYLFENQTYLPFDYSCSQPIPSCIGYGADGSLCPHIVAKSCGECRSWCESDNKCGGDNHGLKGCQAIEWNNSGVVPKSSSCTDKPPACVGIATDGYYCEYPAETCSECQTFCSKSTCGKSNCSHYSFANGQRTKAHVPCVEQSNSLSLPGGGTPIILFGGAIAGLLYLNDVWRFNQTTGKWLEVETTGSTPRPRKGHGIARVGHDFFVVGGSGPGYMNDTHRLNPHTLQWSEVNTTGTGPTPREGFILEAVGSGLWLHGGYGGCGQAMCDDGIFYFNTSTMQWSQPNTTGDSPGPRQYHAAKAVGNVIWIFGGLQYTKFEPYPTGISLTGLIAFNTDSLRWSKPNTTGVAPGPRSSLTAELIDDVIYFLGGDDGNFQCIPAGDSLYTFNTTSLVWSRPALIGSFSLAGASSATNGGIIWLFGGTCWAFNYYQDLFAINIANWTVHGPLNTTGVPGLRAWSTMLSLPPPPPPEPKPGSNLWLTLGEAISVVLGASWIGYFGCLCRHFCKRQKAAKRAVFITHYQNWSGLSNPDCCVTDCKPFFFRITTTTTTSISSEPQFELFLCHRGTQKESFVTPLFILCSSFGKGKIFYDESSMDMAREDRTVDIVYNAVSNTRMMVPILTKDFFDTKWCPAECELFLRRKDSSSPRYLYPIFVQDPSSVRSIGSKKGYPELTRKLKEIVGATCTEELDRAAIIEIWLKIFERYETTCGTSLYRSAFVGWSKDQRRAAAEHVLQQAHEIRQTSSYNMSAREVVGKLEISLSQEVRLDETKELHGVTDEHIFHVPRELT